MPQPYRTELPRVALLTLLLAAFAGACGDSAPPRWVDLARGFEPRPMLDIARGWFAAAPSDTARAFADDDGVWIEATLTPADWTREAAAGLWSLSPPTHSAFESVPLGVLRVAAGDHVFERDHRSTEPSLGTYTIAKGRVVVRLEDDESPPAETTLGIRIENGRSIRGKWRVRGHGRIGDGIAVWHGAPETVRCDLPASSTLHVTTTRTSQDTNATRFRIRVGAQVVLDEEQSEFEVSRSIALPPSARGATELTFDIANSPGHALFLSPTIGPSEVGTYAQRPWSASDEANVVLYLADTFRADNIELGGGAKGLTPRIDAFARQSVAFTSARAVSSWTLPSISTLLTGLYPAQHAAIDEDRTLSTELTTLAELFAARGYRTGAITDAAFFSSAYGLDQGFGFFAETSYPHWNLRRTTDDALAFLDRDDGRPVFLIVHTYRVHAPYRSGPEEDSTEWQAIMREGTARLKAEPRGPETQRSETQRRLFLEYADRFRAMYEVGVRDLDVEFGRFYDEASRCGVFTRGHLVFTSDHGESFGENGDVFHSKELWETQIRVPLLIGGAQHEARVIERGVSLVDLPPTLLELAGATAPGSWNGTSLLTPTKSDPVLAFLLGENKKQLVIIDGAHKVFALPDEGPLGEGEYLRAFDLNRDPGETESAQPAWASELCRGFLPLVRDSLDPRASASTITVHSRPDLRAIGYGGE